MSAVIDERPLTDDELFEILAAVNPRARHIVGAESGSSKRVYACRLCGAEVDSESAKWPQTVHARRAIHEHTDLHRNRPLVELREWGKAVAAARAVELWPVLAHLAFAAQTDRQSRRVLDDMLMERGVNPLERSNADLLDDIIAAAALEGY